jgi:hypothetical protein
LGRRRAAAELIAASNASVLDRALVATQRLVLRTQAGPLRPVWALCYAVAVRALAAAVRRGEPALAVYLKGSLTGQDPVYGLSDIDFSIVTPADPGSPGTARTRVRERALRLARRLPGRLKELLYSSVHEQEDLDETGSEPVFVYGLDHDPRDGAPAGLYFSLEEERGRLGLHERPGVYGPMEDWRLVAGPERRPSGGSWDLHRRRMAAWLELQTWWSRTVSLSVRPDAMGAAYLAVKLVAEPARIWLLLTEGERCESRVEALRMAREYLPAEAEAFEGALDLHRRIPRRPAVDVPRTLAALTRLSSLIAQRLVDDVGAMGTTPVSLLGAAQVDLMPANGGWSAPLPESAPKPLADWRAIVWPGSPDESFVTVSGSPADPVTVAACFEVEKGPFPTLLAGGLLVRPPARRRSKTVLRTLQCRISDPVSFALLDGAKVARFPRAPGWSARDWARRATAEHAGWLASKGPLEASGSTLGRLASAARVALFLQSQESREPRLPLTVAATLEALAASFESQRAVAESAAEEYANFAARKSQPSATTVRSLERFVRRLAPYDAHHIS